MNNFTLVIDESGAKGYASTPERSVGEIGLMAGFTYNTQDIQTITRTFSYYLSDFITFRADKFHITDLSIKQQRDIRKLIFTIAKKLKLEWMFSAVYAQGFHESRFANKGGHRNKGKLLHVELFRSMLMKSVTLASGQNIKDLKLKVLTDTIDPGTMKKFQATAVDIRYLFLNEPKTYTTKYWDSKRNKVRESSIEMSIHSEKTPTFSSLDIEIVCEKSILTIIADVLANSTLFYLKQNQQQNLMKGLNTQSAINGHPLTSLALMPQKFGDYFSILDSTYQRKIV